MTQTKVPFYSTPISIIVCFLILFSVEAVLMVVPENTYEAMIKENGPIENLSALGYILGAIWLFIRSFRIRNYDCLWSGVIILFLALRELDFHVRFTTMGIFKSRYYLSGDVPFGEKIIVTFIVSAMLITLIWFFSKHWKHLLSEIVKGKTWALSVATAIVLAVFTKMLDRLNSELSEFILKFTQIPTERLFQISEEVLELGIPILLLLAIASKREQN